MLTSKSNLDHGGVPLPLLQVAIRRLQPGWIAPITEFDYLEGGYSNANFRFCYGEQQYVLRTPLASSARASVDVSGLIAEIHFRSLMHSACNLVVAPFVAADVQRGEMITAFVQGPTLAQEPPTAEQAIAYLRHLHQQLAPIPQAGRYEMQALVDRWLPSPPAWLAVYLAQATDEQRLADNCVQCCHNDLNPWNVIRSAQSPQAWTTLDWETVKQAHPVFDAVTLHQGLAAEQTDLALDAARDIVPPGWPELAEFCKAAVATIFNPGVIEAALRRYWLREYAWASAQLDGGNQNPAIVAQRVRAQAQLRRLL